MMSRRHRLALAVVLVLPSSAAAFCPSAHRRAGTLLTSTSQTISRSDYAQHKDVFSDDSVSEGRVHVYDDGVGEFLDRYEYQYQDQDQEEEVYNGIQDDGAVVVEEAEAEEGQEEILNQTLGLTLSLSLSQPKEEPETETEPKPQVTIQRERVEKPTLEILKRWTLNYMATVQEAGGFTHMEGYQDFIADDFVQTGPSFGPINKEDIRNLYSYYNDNGLDIGKVTPDLKTDMDGWHQDPHDPWRIWVVTRYSGTHKTTAKVPSKGLTLSPTGKFATGPELQSFRWTQDQQIQWHTSGHVGDAHTGSNQGYGGVLGFLVSFGLPRLVLDALGPIRTVASWTSQFRAKNKNEPRSRSPYSKLPQWWHDRKSSKRNILN